MLRFFRCQPLASENFGSSVSFNTMLSMTDMLPTRPILFLSSGIWDTFSWINPLGEKVATRLPFMSTVPPSGAMTPVTSCASWL